MGYRDDELALREAQINRKRKRNRKRLLVGAGVAAGGALALNNDKIRNKVTNHLRSDSQMMNNIGNGVRKVGNGIYNNFKPSATTMSIRRGTERAADAISNYTPKYNKRRRKLANIIDDLYHSGYSDGYYAGMELYHADTEMTEEERKARRKKRRRNIALGVAGVAGAGAAGYAIGRALRKRGRGTVPTGSTGSNGPRFTGGPSGPTGPRPAGSSGSNRLRFIGGPSGPTVPRLPGSNGPRFIGGPSGPRLTGPSGSNRLRFIGGPSGPRPTGPSGSNRLSGPKLKRVYVDPRDVEEPIGWDFKRNRPKYRSAKY